MSARARERKRKRKAMARARSLALRVCQNTLLFRLKSVFIL
jgi:hypothetical protein